MVTPTGTRSSEQDQFEKVAYLEMSVQTSITAKTTATQGNSTQLSNAINVLTVVSTGTDGVKLPPSRAGMVVVVINDGASAAQVFGYGTDTIDGVTTATGVPLTNAKRSLFFCSVEGSWHSLMGAVSS